MAVLRDHTGLPPPIRNHLAAVIKAVAPHPEVLPVLIQGAAVAVQEVQGLILREVQVQEVQVAEVVQEVLLVEVAEEEVEDNHIGSQKKYLLTKKLMP